MSNLPRMHCLLILQALCSLLLVTDAQQGRVAQVCEGQILNLYCEVGRIIHVDHVILADSSCYGSANCCPRITDCTSQPSDGHRSAVLTACNGRRACAVRSVRELTSCRVFLVPVNNDYEKIIYNCVDVNECSSTYAGRRCSQQAICTNTPGSFNCQCKNGYSGDGFTCSVAETSSPLSTSAITTGDAEPVGTMTSRSAVKLTDVDETVKIMDSLIGGDETDAEIMKSLTSTQILAIFLGVLGLVVLLVSINMFLWCRLKQQRRRRRVSEKQLELTLRRGSSTVGTGATSATTSLADDRSGGCSGRPTAIVRAVDTRSGLTASCNERTNCDVNGGDDRSRVHGIGDLPLTGRPCNANQYEKLDYATNRKPMATPKYGQQVDQGCGESCLPDEPPTSVCALATCREAGEAADDDACCSVTGYEGEGCYEDLDDYLKPMTELDECCGQVK